MLPTHLRSVLDSFDKPMARRWYKIRRIYFAEKLGRFNAQLIGVTGKVGYLAKELIGEALAVITRMQQLLLLKN